MNKMHVLPFKRNSDKNINKQIDKIETWSIYFKDKTLLLKDINRIFKKKILRYSYI